MGIKSDSDDVGSPNIEYDVPIANDGGGVRWITLHGTLYYEVARDILSNERCLVPVGFAPFKTWKTLSEFQALGLRRV